MIKNNKGKGKTGFKFKNIVGNIGEINYLDKNGDENDARKMLIPINMEEKLLRLQYDMNLEFSNILPLLKKYVYAQQDDVTKGKDLERISYVNDVELMATLWIIYKMELKEGELIKTDKINDGITQKKIIEYVNLFDTLSQNGANGFKFRISTIMKSDYFDLIRTIIKNLESYERLSKEGISNIDTFKIKYFAENLYYWDFFLGKTIKRIFDYAIGDVASLEKLDSFKNQIPAILLSRAYSEIKFYGFSGKKREPPEDILTSIFYGQSQITGLRTIKFGEILDEVKRNLILDIYPLSSFAINFALGLHELASGTPGERKLVALFFDIEQKTNDPRNQTQQIEETDIPQNTEYDIFLDGRQSNFTLHYSFTSSMFLNTLSAQYAMSNCQKMGGQCNKDWISQLKYIEGVIIKANSRYSIGQPNDKINQSLLLERIPGFNEDLQLQPRERIMRTICRSYNAITRNFFQKIYEELHVGTNAASVQTSIFELLEKNLEKGATKTEKERSQKIGPKYLDQKETWKEADAKVKELMGSKTLQKEANDILKGLNSNHKIETKDKVVHDVLDEYVEGHDKHKTFLETEEGKQFKEKLESTMQSKEILVDEIFLRLGIEDDEKTKFSSGKYEEILETRKKDEIKIQIPTIDDLRKGLLERTRLYDRENLETRKTIPMKARTLFEEHSGLMAEMSNIRKIYEMESKDEKAAKYTHPKKESFLSYQERNTKGQAKSTMRLSLRIEVMKTEEFQNLQESLRSLGITNDYQTTLYIQLLEEICLYIAIKHSKDQWKNLILRYTDEVLLRLENGEIIRL